MIYSDFSEIQAACGQKGNPLRIDLGCGDNKTPGFFGIDRIDLPGVDYVANLEQGLAFIPDNAVDEYVTVHFLEHIENFELLLMEIHRTLKPNGRARIFVPHFSNPYYYSDYTHKRFFGLYSFDYFSGRSVRVRRNRPRYGQSFEFEVISRRLIFTSPYFPLLSIFKKHITTRLFNMSDFMQELYEDFFSSKIPCYELEFVLKPVKD